MSESSTSDGFPAPAKKARGDSFPSDSSDERYALKSFWSV